MAALKLLKDDAPKGERVLTAIDTLQSWVMKLVRLVMQLTPYGVLALMTKVVAGSNLQDIIKLGSFVVASYGPWHYVRGTRHPAGRERRQPAEILP